MKLKSLFAGTALLLALSLTGCSGSVEKGLEYLEAGEFESAAEEFQAAAEKDKDAAEAFRGLGIAKWDWTTAPKRRGPFIILSVAATFASAIRLRL